MTDFHRKRLNRFFEIYRCNDVQDMHKTIALFILHDLNNYVGRYRRLRGIPGTSDYTQLLRYGKSNVRQILSEQRLARMRGLPSTIEYWRAKGFDETGAKQRVSEWQTEMSSRSPSTRPGAREYSIRCHEYWIRHGHSYEDALIAVANSQRRRHTEERNIRWQNTLKSKPPDEIALINLKKGWTVESLMARGHTAEAAERISREHWGRRNCFSKSSQVFFEKLTDSLDDKGVFYATLNHEAEFHGKRVDFYHAGSGTVVEYYGTFWHRHPDFHAPDDRHYGRTSSEIWESDRQRIALIESHPDVSSVIIVWETDAASNLHKLLTDIAVRINNNDRSRNH